MDSQGYTYKPNRFRADITWVYTPQGRHYIVRADRPGARGYCTCPFFLENGICKHHIKGSEKMDELIADALRADEYCAMTEEAYGEDNSKW